MIGRPPKPTALKVLEGNPGRRPLPKGEPARKVSLPAPPRHLDPIGREAWRRFGRVLVARQVVTEGDAHALELLCSAYSEYRRAEKVCREQGFTYETKTEQGSTLIRRRPESEIVADAWRRVMNGLTHFGLTPAASPKVAMVGDQDPKNAREATIAALVR